MSALFPSRVSQSAKAPSAVTEIRLDDVTFGYERHPAVHHISGTFRAGSLTTVVGPNGSGKSTLLKGLAGALPALSGRITRSGFKKADLAYLPQDPGIDRAFPATLGELVSLGFWARRGLFGQITSKDRHALAHALQAVGLSGFEERALSSISGGQLQRALFARVLLQEARVILLDEPFSATDQRTAQDLMALVRQWPSEGRLVVMVTHDLAMAETCGDTVLLLAREPVAWGAPSEVLTEAHLHRARHLCEAFDDHAHICRRQG